MKLSITALVTAFALFGLVTVGMAQTSPPTSSPPSPSSAATPGKETVRPSTDDATKPSADIKGEVKTDNRDTTIDSRRARPDQRDDVSALPRSVTTDRNTIFGLTPAASMIVGAALLLIVILAIVALGRGGSSDVYIDRDRRM